uniref:Uncharacterized protein n=2 Tax=Fabrea salina TaxID=342563 RepID=A0A7S3I948_9CILI|mmetsp:Transcript_1455/g.2335  ORF Transcript_1455/g.2335 Transcript_1455/m.2335 type:complete len:185 (+) Transcript_1455:644-1198(+)
MTNYAHEDRPSLACESLYSKLLNYYKKNITEYQCDDPPKSINGQAAECQKDSDCKVSDGSHTHCDCGLSGKKYCELAEGDDYALEFNKFYKQWFLSPEVSNCNAIGRFHDECIYDYMSKNLSTYYDYYFILKKNYHLIKGADEKLVKVLAPRLYSLNQTINGDNDEDSSRLIGIFYALMVLILA